MSPVSASARAEWSRRLGRALVNEGYVSEHTISPLLEEAASTGSALGVLLIRRGVVAPPVVVNTLAQLARLPVVDLQSDPPSPDAMQLVPALVAHDHQAVGVRVVGNQAVVAFAEPPDAADVRSIGGLVGLEVVPALGDPVAIAQLTANGAGVAHDAPPTGPAQAGAAPAPSAPPSAQPEAATMGEALRARPNPELELLGVVLTLFDRRTNLARDIQKQINQVFGDKVFKTVIGKNVRLEESPAYKETIFSFAPGSPGAVDYEHLALEVLQRVA